MRVTDTSQYVVVELGFRHDIVSFQEKPDSAEAISNLANTGVYVLELEIFGSCPSTRFSTSPRRLSPLFSGRRGTRGYEGSFYWSDIGTLKPTGLLNHDALSGKVRLNIPGEHLTEGLWVESGARIHPTVDIDGRVVVSRNAVIGRGVTMIGDVTVGSDCWVRSGRHHQAEHSPSGILCRRGCLPGRLHSWPRLRRAGRSTDQGRGAGPSYAIKWFSSLNATQPPRSIAPTHGMAIKLFVRMNITIIAITLVMVGSPDFPQLHVR